MEISLDLDLCISIFGKQFYMEEEEDEKYIDIIKKAYKYIPIFEGTIFIVKKIVCGARDRIKDNYMILSSNDIDHKGSYSILIFETMCHIINSSPNVFIFNGFSELNRFEYLGAKWASNELRQGYISKYAMSGVAADICETFTEIVTMFNRYDGFAYDRPVLKKMTFICDTLSKIDKYTKFITRIRDIFNAFDYRKYLCTVGCAVPSKLITKWKYGQYGYDNLVYYNKGRYVYVKGNATGTYDTNYVSSGVRDDPNFIQYPKNISIDGGNGIGCYFDIERDECESPRSAFSRGLIKAIVSDSELFKPITI